MAAPGFAISAVAALFICCLTPDGAVAEGLKQPIVLHTKARRSALLLRGGAGVVNDGIEGTELLQQLARASRATGDDLTASAKGALSAVEVAHNQTKQVLHNSNAERDMLETQLLANGESLHIIKKLIETVKKMKAQVDSLEGHKQKCEKKLADIKGARRQHEMDSLAANTIQVSS